MESTVLEHEFGHLMGLVNLGTPEKITHQDVAHGNHCTDPNCLMYWEKEFSMAGFVPKLDSNCLNDLRGNGGK